jgi:hypothetical protein
MILAAPLVIPFAEAVGISIASLGMAKAADMVNEYIQENPEQSVKILSTIVPNVGIGQIFANKEDSDDEEIEVEEDTRSKKEIVLGELAKDKGNYSDEDAEGKYASKRGRIIRALEDAGKVNPDREYNPEKKYQGYKRFLKKADGGAIGIEVLFGPKRQNFFMGGPALTGQPLAIYNSMKAYQSFTDQEIADAIKQAGYDLPTADSGTTPPDSTPDSSQSSGNDGRAAPPVGSVSGGSGLIGDYMAATQGRQDRLTNPNVPTSFISSLTGGGQRDIGEMIRSGEVDTRKSSGIPLGVGSAIARMLPDKYYDMSLADQVFTQAMMGYTGPTVFGENTSGLQKDPFGLNVRSGFGNYAEAVGENFNQLRDTLTKDRAGVTFNEETGMFEGVNADAVNKQTEMIRNKYNFRKQQLGVKNVLDSKIKAADEQREKDRLAAEAKAKAEAAAKQKIADEIKAQEEAKKQKAKLDAIKIEAANREAAREAARKEAARKSAIAQEKANREAAREAARKEAARKSAIAQEKANREAAREAARKEAARKSAIAQEKANRDAAREAARKEAARKSAAAQEKANRDAAREAAKKAAAQKRNTANNTPPSQRGGGGNGGGRGDRSGGRSSGSGESDYGGFCFDPRTLIQMADGSTKQIKNIQLGDVTKGGEVTGVFQFKAADEIHDYKGVTVAGSHYVKEDGKFIMVKDSPLSVKIDKIPVVYSLDTTGRRIFIKDIEFADYNGDGVAKNFLTNAGVDLTGFDTEVLRQVENRLI